MIRMALIMANLLIYESDTMNEVLCLPMAEITSIQIKDGIIRVVYVVQDAYKVTNYPIAHYSVVTIE